MKIKHKLTAISMLLTTMMFSACGGCGGYSGGSGGETPTGITELSSAISNETITLTWKDPESAFDHIEITWSPDGTTTQNVAAGGQTYKAESLTNGTLYTFTVKSIDAASAVTSEAMVKAKPGILVYTAEDMNNVRNDLTGYYILMADISLLGYSSGEGWEPICNNATPFTGTFDGNGYVISGVVIDRAAENQGLLGNIGTGAVVKDLRLADCDVNGTSYVGALAGKSSGEIRNCSVSGNVCGSLHYIGGLVGSIYNGTISRCRSAGNVSAYEFVGGLIGDILELVDGTVIVSFCYATGAVSGDLDLGGLLANIDEDAALNFCYYDRETTGMSDTGKGDPKYTAEMKQQSTYDDGAGDGTDDDWDFTAVWAIDTDSSGGFINNGYPYLINNPPVD